MIFVAEIGMNHNGNFGLFHEMIKKAAISGADIVKFQLGWRDGENEINSIRSKDIENIIKISNYYNIEWMFSILSDKALDRIKPFNPKRYKVASRTVIENPNLVQKIIDEGKETFISLGMWKKEDFPDFKGNNIKYIWCKSNYPTAPWDIKKFPKSFSKDKYYGISDHTIGNELCYIAISRGANFVEKHFTLDKSDTTIRDHALSLTPDEFKSLVKNGRDICNILKYI